jgi:hypothetical protein
LHTLYKMWCKYYITHIILVAAGLWHLGPCFIMTHRIHIWVIYRFTLVWYSPKQGTTHIPTSHLVHLNTLPFLWPQEQHRWQHSWVHDFAGQCLSWQLLSCKTFFEPSSPDSELVTANRISLMATASSLIFFQPSLRHLQWSALFRLFCMAAQLQKCNATETWMSYTIDSKTDLKLRCDYCTKFQLFKGAQDITGRLTAVCCMLLS